MGTSRLLAAIVAAFVWVGSAHGAGGDYVFDGGSARDRAEVNSALAASSFDWGVVGHRVTIHIGDGVLPLAAPGHVWIDSALLRAGVFSWATVQDEYAHQVDFFALGDQERALLNSRLGGTVWCHADRPGLPHSAYGCERFTSTLVWAYWPARANAYRPQSASDESAAMAPARFRALLDGLLGKRPAVRHLHEPV